MRSSRSFLAFGSLALLLASLPGCYRKPLLWHPSPIEAGKPASKDFTVTWNYTDHNGSPIDPAWSFHPTFPPQTGECATSPETSGCTDHDVVLDLADFPNALVCNAEVRSRLHGHVNWTPATAYGKVLWMNLATDTDVNLKFFPRGGRGLTTNNEESPLLNGADGRFIELEFSSSETLANFTSKWWTDLFGFAKADRRAFSRIDPLLNSQHPGTASNAVVYGLFGLDCEHDCRSEYHPVYAMAIEVDDRPDHNVWAIMVRNWGNEGFCGRLNHELYTPDDKLRLVLPRSGGRPEMVKAGTEFRATNRRIPFPDVAFHAGPRQVVLTVTLPEPRTRVNGEMLLQLRWPEGFDDIPPNLTRADVPEGEFFDAAEEEPESFLDRVIGERPQLRDRIDTAEAAFFDADEKTQPVGTPDGGPLPNFEEPQIPRRRTTARLEVDQEKIEADRARWRAVCDAYAKEQGQQDPKLPDYRGRDISEVCRMVR